MIARDGQAGRGARAEMQDQQREARHQDRGKGRYQRGERVVEIEDRQAQAQHGDEMHRPDAAAKDDGRHGHHRLAMRRGQTRRATGQRQAGEARHQRDGERCEDEPPVMAEIQHAKPSLTSHAGAETSPTAAKTKARNGGGVLSGGAGGGHRPISRAFSAASTRLRTCSFCRMFVM